ncbi:HTH domain-containing protein [Paraburkholderia silvatlantica]|uniref:HTH domain-containing protein n=1 Tax=Paraburkholderia silvatlantica TaxID=321895 RepID=A0A2V4UHC6_9BURK|nr:HTH domain-containing protein [Paraburkholderia silvatlantica]
MEILRTRRRPVTAARLAEEFAVSERTIYRDVAEPVAQGVPVDGGAGVGYALKPGHFLPPLMFAREELEANMLGVHYVDQRGDDVLKTAATAARSRIAAVLPPDASATLDVPLAMPGPPVPSFPLTWSNSLGCARRFARSAAWTSFMRMQPGAVPGASSGQCRSSSWTVRTCWPHGASCARRFARSAPTGYSEPWKARVIQQTVRN